MKIYATASRFVGVSPGKLAVVDIYFFGNVYMFNIQCMMAKL